MIKAAILLATGAVPKALAALTQRKVAALRSKRTPVWKKYDILEESGFDREFLHIFASHVRAQDLPPSAFHELLLVGKRDVASWFFELTPDKGDLLDGYKVDMLLSTPNLRFMSRQGELTVVETAQERAIRILCGCAQFTPHGLASLAVDKHCAMVILATRAKEVMTSEVIAQAVASSAGFHPADVKRYCMNPRRFTEKLGSSISKLDLVIIKALSKNPDKIWDILYTKAA